MLPEAPPNPGLLTVDRSLRSLRFGLAAEIKVAGPTSLQ